MGGYEDLPCVSNVKSQNKTVSVNGVISLVLIELLNLMGGEWGGAAAFVQSFCSLCWEWIFLGVPEWQRPAPGGFSLHL